MSLRAELVRLCLPWFMRPRFPARGSNRGVRRRMARFRRLIPPPPRGTEVTAVDAGGVKGERITTPRSLHNRYVLHSAAAAEPNVAADQCLKRAEEIFAKDYNNGNIQRGKNWTKLFKYQVHYNTHLNKCFFMELSTSSMEKTL
jgi:hypothetical protein